jgi:hypothetical protein
MQLPSQTAIEAVKRRKISEKAFPKTIRTKPTGKTAGEKQAEFESPLSFAPEELASNPFMAALSMKWRIRQANVKDVNSMQASFFIGPWRVRGIEKNHVDTSFRFQHVQGVGWHENIYEFDKDDIPKKASNDHRPIEGLESCQSLKELALKAMDVWNIKLDFEDEYDKQPKLGL